MTETLQPTKRFSTLMRQSGWKDLGEGVFERVGMTAYARAVCRFDGSLTVFVGRNSGGGSLTIPKSSNPSTMVDKATEFAR
jgi:hypothetical protein